MHKVDSPGATAQNEFTNGDVLNGIPRTILEAKFMNAVQRELIAPVSQAGIALDDAQDNQLMQCLPLHVSTITALRTLSVPAIPATQTILIFVRGGAVDGDGAGSFYRWVSTSSAADDGVTTIRPDSAPAQGRWIRSTSTPSGHTHTVGEVSGAAPLASPAFTGIPTAPTAGGATNNTQLATTAFVQGRISALIAAAPAALDTLNELAAALGDDSNFAATMTAALAGKAPTSHNHSAAQITSGTLAEARLPATVAIVESGTFVGTLTGCTTAPTKTFQYRRVGSIVTMWMEAGSPLVGESNSNAMSVTGIPVAIQPNSPNGKYQSAFAIDLHDQGNTQDGYGMVAVPGQEDRIVFHLNAGVAGSFTSSGQKGIGVNGFSITYGLG